MNNNDGYNDILLKDRSSHYLSATNYRSIVLFYTHTLYQCHSYPIFTAVLPCIDVNYTHYQYLLHPVSMITLPTINTTLTRYQCHCYPLIIPLIPTISSIIARYQCHCNTISTVPEQTINSSFT